MLTTIGRFVATRLVVALALGIFAKIAPIGIGQRWRSARSRLMPDGLVGFGECGP
jgi:hypothetical protein